MAAYRGYFQGLKNMVPTAISQVMEQIGRVIIGLGLAVFLLSRGTEYAAAGASFGATAGGIAGLLTMLVIYFRQKKKIISEFQPIEEYKEEENVEEVAEEEEVVVESIEETESTEETEEDVINSTYEEPTEEIVEE